MAYAPRSNAPRPGGEGGDADRRRGRGRRDDNRDNRGGDRENDEFKDKLVTINRVAKVVKGGRRFSFAALVVVGDEKGRVGWGAGKAREVPEAIRKATERAKRGLIRVPMREGRTLHHDVIGEFGAGRVILRAAPAGTGIIAGGPMRAVFEVLGMGDVVAKCTGTTNPHNMVKATFAGLARCTSPRAVAARRGKKVADLLPSSRGGDAANASGTASSTETANV
ncbi:MAG TPA: 30S ribosomal protein S5 [Roseomonas sp.]|jgi:small subunit ribosomal protein S5